MKKIIIMVSFFFMFSCSKTVDSEQAKQELMQTDRDFSTLSQEKGRNFAFLSYIDEQGVMLRTNSKPIEGKIAVSSLFSAEDDSHYSLTWQPTKAEVSASGDLGYTYGIYEFKVDSIIEKGTYATVWKKNKNGQWKFVLDTGNKGISE